MIMSYCIFTSLIFVLDFNLQSLCKSCTFQTITLADRCGNIIHKYESAKEVTANNVPMISGLKT